MYWHHYVRIVVLGLGATLSQVAEAASFHRLGFLAGDDASFARAVSADGSTVVGGSGINFGLETFTAEAVRWITDNGGTLQGLGQLDPGDVASLAVDVSDDGSVVVGSGFETLADPIKGFRWTESSGTLTSLGSLAANSQASSPAAVSGDGQIVVGQSGQSAFRWTNVNGGSMTALAPLNGLVPISEALDISPDGSRIVGWAINSVFRPVATRWTNPLTTIIDMGLVVSTDRFSRAMAVSTDGTMATGVSGNVNTTANTATGEAFRWVEGSGPMTGLGFLDPSHEYSIGHAVTDSSAIVGSSGLLADLNVVPLGPVVGGVAFVWDSRRGMRDLKDVLTNEFGLDLTGWSLIEALDVTPDGRTIVGAGENPMGDFEGWIVKLDRPIDTDPGDANRDGVVDVADLGILGANFNLTNTDFGTGDFNGDGSTDVADLGVLAARWSANNPLTVSQALEQTGLSAAVPEPVSVALWALALPALMRRRS